jgi:hypothetical protein
MKPTAETPAIIISTIPSFLVNAMYFGQENLLNPNRALKSAKNFE